MIFSKKVIMVIISFLYIIAIITSCTANVKEDDSVNDGITTTIGSKNHNTTQITTQVQETIAPAPVTTAYPDGIRDPSEINFKLTQESVATLNPSAYTAFKNSAVSSFVIPALKQYMVPQGMDIWEEMNWIIISGYFSNDKFSKSSVLVAVDIESGKLIGECFIKNINGSNNTSHVGGVAITKKNLFISSGKKLLRIPLSSLLSAKQSGDVRIEEEIPVPVNASFCNYSNGILWVGDFQYGTDYPTDSFRHMKNRDGKMYYAWTVGYKLDKNTQSEIKASSMLPGFTVPDFILSTTEKIQGFTAPSDEHIVLSQSYGRKNTSVILFYKNPIKDTPHDYYEYNNLRIPVWFLDSRQEVKKISAPPMTEGIASSGNSVYILFESGAIKYREDGGLNPTDSIWVMDVPKALR